ncbi:hypothetical protein JJQ72_18195 [Paenibacillus sp. F411]|uniref:hypothetical protein n=1 Tax=Paenibacillus sp. F411 TaxID=2820239 RepID=UPI001AAEC4BE|nr:hypothetical protein [Paenibacillus sp. F411]MBO2945915.1 hypothetical protein [Paenibacillus sp. F411]
MATLTLRIPLFIFALGVSVFLCDLIRESQVVNSFVASMSFWVVAVAFMIGFEKTGLSEKKVPLLYGVLVALVGVFIEFLVEPQDILSLFPF